MRISVLFPAYSTFPTSPVPEKSARMFESCQLEITMSEVVVMSPSLSMQYPSPVMFVMVICPEACA